MDITTITMKIKKSSRFLEKEFSVKKIGVFGSYVRGEQKKESDVDILVDFYEEPSFFKFLALERNLSDLLGVKVDLVMKNALKPYIGKYILEEVVYL